MITPTRIEVRNIRSISHAVIEPLDEGVTALSGPIGAGKSTMLNAALWALYGEVGGVAGLLAQNEMRRKGCPDGEHAEAIVDFTFSGTEYRAVRRLRRSKSGKETASAEWWVEGSKQQQITPTKLTEKVTALTGLTGRAFAGAFFIPQGNLPALAEGTPSEVQRLIEEQTCLTPLTRRADSARREAKDAQIVADAQPGSREELDAAQAEVDTTQAAGEQAWTAKETAEAREAKATETHRVAAEALGSVQSRDRAAQEAREGIATQRGRLSSAREHVEALTAEAEQNPVTDIDSTRTAQAALRSAIDTYDAAARNRATTEQAAVAAQEKAQAAKATAEAAVDPSADLWDARAAYDDAQARRGAAAGEWDRLARAISALRSTTPDEACCPTCTQRLPDPLGLMDDLIGHQQKVAADGKAAAEAMTAAQKRVDSLNAQAQEAANARHAAQSAQEAATTAATAAREAAAEHEASVEALIRAVTVHATHTGGLDDGVGEDAARAAALSGVDAAAGAVAAHERAVKVRDDLAVWRTRVADTEARIASMEDTAKDAPSREALDTAAQEEAAARAALDREREAASTARTDARVAQQAVTSAEAHRDRAKRDYDAKVDAAVHADTLRHAANLLGALRTDLLTEYTATISASATDLMQQIGGGDHTGVAIDQNFTPCVTLADGTMRPMRVLSGGEKMRAALCLRLGIADQITGDASGAGMIFADEITANHDEDTTTAVVDLIRGLGRPMLIIAHASEVDQAANRVYRVEKPSETTGGEVTLAGAGATPPAQDPAA